MNVPTGPADALAATAAGLHGIWLNRTGDTAPSGVEAIDNLTDLPSLLKIPTTDLKAANQAVRVAVADPWARDGSVTRHLATSPCTRQQVRHR